MTRLSELTQDTLTKATSEIDDKYEEFIRNLNRHREKAKRFRQEMTDVFERTGVIVIPSFYDYSGDPQTLEQYGKMLLEKTKRPRIIADRRDRQFIRGHYNFVDITLDIPSNKRLAGVVAGLRMLGTQLRGDARAPEEFRLLYVQKARTMTFYFKGDEGKDIFDEWLQTCENDPVYRVLLDLPAK